MTVSIWFGLSLIPTKNRHNLGKGAENKIRISYGLLPNPPSDPPQPPPGMVFLRIKKFTPIFFWKLNLLLPKRILHLVPLKNLSFLSSYNGLLFPLIDYSKGRGDHQGSHKVTLSKLSY